MKQFFKIFFASLAALFVFTIICFFISFVVMVMVAYSSATMNNSSKIAKNSVLVLDLSDALQEQSKENLSVGFNFSTTSTLGLYDVIRMINYAKNDDKIKGIYIKSGANVNGFATSHELRKAIEDFKQSKKFVLAYSTSISQKAYYIASVADKIYLHPQGMMEWTGLASIVSFYKGTLDKLEIQPEIFFAGKYKSATEPFRVTQMTEANREQTYAWLNDLNNIMLSEVSSSRKIDTSTLRNLANNLTIQRPQDALNAKLIDGLKYNDEVQSELRKMLNIKEENKLNLVSLDKYSKNKTFKKKNSSGNKIALLYAEGSITENAANNKGITSKEYLALLRKIRLDKDIKALVFRVNSPGGSALASDEIWREIQLIKKDKPVVVSMGDVAASGGYYISCAANKIYADPNTITGSIGVFALMGNLENFFKNKLGVTFDEVKTAPYADFGNMTRSMTDGERKFFQSFVDTTYETFKSRVAQGRNKSMMYIDSIAQGHVWSGTDAKDIGLVDEIGTLQDAIKYTSGLIKAKDYQIKEYPATKSLYEQFLDMTNEEDKGVQETLLRKQFGQEAVNLYQQFYMLRNMINIPQAMMPYTFEIK